MEKNGVVAHIEQQLKFVLQDPTTFGELHLHSDCFAKTLRMKDRLPFFCTSCGAGRDGEWIMQPHNVFSGKGCPCCQSIAGVKARFDAATHLESYQISAVSAFSGMANVNSVRYTITSPDGLDSNPLLKSTLNCAIRQCRIPDAAELTAQREAKEIVEKFKAVFNKGGEIFFVAWSMDHLTTPGPFFNIRTGMRILREPLTNSAIPMSGVRGLIEREMKDGKTQQVWLDEAKTHEAIIIGYKHTLGKQVKIKYQSRTGFEKEHTYTRAKETNWGQSGFKKGEKLCQAILLELFPDNSWVWNKRYKFLQYESSNLELDGYSKILNLALEHQGDQHYNPNNAFDSTPEQFTERIKRDIFKVKQCAIEKIKFLIVTPLKLDPAIYLSFIKRKLKSLSISFPAGVTVEQVTVHWKKICTNPLQRLQASVILGLGIHKLFSPELERVTAVTIIKYRCGHCGEINGARAQGFTSGKPRRYCPKCKGKASGAQRRTKMLAHWRKELREVPFSRLLAKSGERIFLLCGKGHEQRVSSVNEVKARHNGDIYRCLNCKILEFGYNKINRTTRSSIASLEQYKREFEAKTKQAGLTLIGDIFMRNDGERGVISALLKCPNEHRFEIELAELSKLCSNKFLSDRSVVPHICDICCYPGIKPDTRKGTVFHRLNFLKNYHPNVELVHGFDFTGMGHEDYWCGERYNISDEKHPNFSIRYATIRTTDKAKVFRMPCYVCAVEKGEKLSSSLKTLEMIEGRMLLISEALSGHTNKLPNTPTVALCSGQKLTDGRYIGTTKTRLFFFAVNQVTHQKRRRPTTTLMFIKEATVKPVCGKLV